MKRCMNSVCSAWHSFVWHGMVSTFIEVVIECLVSCAADFDVIKLDKTNPSEFVEFSSYHILQYQQICSFVFCIGLLIGNLASNCNFLTTHYRAISYDDELIINFRTFFTQCFFLWFCIHHLTITCWNDDPAFSLIGFCAQRKSWSIENVYFFFSLK